MAIYPGTTIFDESGNSLTVTEQIGSGGFGAVFKVSDNKERFLAVKVLQASFPSEEAHKDFLREAQIAQEVQGQHVIKHLFFHDGSTHTGLPPYILMEYASDGSLRNLIQSKVESGEQFSDQELSNMYEQLIAGMNSVNDKLVHRDLKPENILVDGGLLKISDFGLAKISEESTRSRSFKGVGTLRYISPEAIQLLKNTPLMDMYSMGLVFYELATLSYPYADEVSQGTDFRDIHLN